MGKISGIRQYIRQLALALAGAWLIVLAAAAPAPAFDTSLDDELLLLVNGKHTLPADYQPNDLVDTAGRAPSKKGVMQLRAAAAEAYVQMMADYKAETGGKVYSISGFRTYAYQSRLFNSKLASRRNSGLSYGSAYKATAMYTALPGASEHQTGLAIDLSTGSVLSESFRNTGAGKWLMANCWDYGFILRYDEAKTDLTAISYEPWHYRYVGLPHSLIIRDNNWVYEEYISYLQENGSIEYADPEQAGCVYRIYRTDDITSEYPGIVSVSSDNMGGYIITTHIDRLDDILTAWAEQAVRGGLIFFGHGALLNVF